MVWYVFWVQMAQNQFLGSRSLDKCLFKCFRNSLDFPLDSGSNKVFFVKNGIRVMDLWFGKSFGSIGPELVFRSQTLGLRFILTFQQIITFLFSFWIKSGLVCENWKQCSLLMAWYIFWAIQFKTSFQTPDPYLKAYSDFQVKRFIRLNILHQMRPYL